MIEKIDAHSHFGKDAFFPVEGDLNKYIGEAKKIGIKETLAMPVACPKISKDDKSIILLQNNYDGEKVEHYKVIIKGKKSKKIKHQSGYNPYSVANTEIFNLKGDHKGIQFHYVPLIHPFYYSDDDLFLQKIRGAKALKIHGIAGGVNPKYVQADFLKKIEKLGIPIILHTDYNPNCYIQKVNTTENWLEILKDYNIKAMFTHSARLSKDAIKIINEDKRYIVGLAPDIYLMSDKDNFKDYPENYYEKCFSEFSENKIFFDIDYPWNIHSIKNINLDWKSVERIEKTCTDKEKLEKFYNGNIRNFLGLRKNIEIQKEGDER